MAANEDHSYAPPRTGASQSVPLSHAAPAGRTSIVRWIALISLGLCTAFCIFWLSAAIWEVASMPDDAYGRHTAMFRGSYVRAGALAILLGAISVIAGLCVKRGRRFDG